MEGESETRESKKSTVQLDKSLKAICGFLNHKGGKVYFGIDDTGKVVGQEVSDQTLKSISQKIRQKIKPEVSPEIRVVEIEGKTVVEVKIKEGNNKPYYLNGIPYKRVGTESPVIPPDELEGIILRKHEQEFDSKICRDARLEDIDEEIINKFREMYEEINKTKIKGSNLELLKSLGCIRKVNGKVKVTNAGILLFGEKPKSFFPMSYITIVRYPGKEKTQTYSDIKDFYGNLFNIVDSANEYIKEHVQEVSRVVEGKLAREVIPQYPYFAIRELITNAIVHRDYSVLGSRIIIRMFKDRIEFSSPGCLPANITPKNIIYEQYSRNPIIADVFNRVKFIEKLGEGWDKIIDSVRKHPFKPKLPKIIDTKNTVIVSLFSVNLGKIEIEKEKLRQFDRDMVNEWLTQVNAKLTQELSDKEKEIFFFVIKNKKITSADCQRLLNISRVMANRYFGGLIKKGLLNKKGGGKSTFYILSEQKR